MPVMMSPWRYAIPGDFLEEVPREISVEAPEYVGKVEARQAKRWLVTASSLT